MAYPAAYKYTKTHEWIDPSVTPAAVGITDYAQHSLGDIVFVELPKEGQTLEGGTLFGSVESVKAVSDLYAPASGTVIEVNDALTSAPETINSDANATWLFKMELTDPLPAELLDAEAYEKYVAEETH